VYATRYYGTRYFPPRYFSEGAESDVTAPTLSGQEEAETFSFGTFPFCLTDEANGTAYAIASTSATPPSVAQIQAGNDSSGAAAVAAGSQSVNSTSIFFIEPLAGLQHSTSYWVYMQQQDAAGNDSTVIGIEITTESANPSAASTGATTGRGGMHPNTGEGVAYWIFDESDTLPSIAQIQAGNDAGGGPADDSGNDTITENERYEVDATGLTEDNTYYVYFQYQADEGEDSPVFLAGSFTAGEQSAATPAAKASTSDTHIGTGIGIAFSFVLSFLIKVSTWLT